MKSAKPRIAIYVLFGLLFLTPAASADPDIRSYLAGSVGGETDHPIDPVSSVRFDLSNTSVEPTPDTSRSSTTYTVRISAVLQPSGVVSSTYVAHLTIKDEDGNVVKDFRPECTVDWSAGTGEDRVNGYASRSCTGPYVSGTITIEWNETTSSNAAKRFWSVDVWQTEVYNDTVVSNVTLSDHTVTVVGTWDDWIPFLAFMAAAIWGWRDGNVWLALVGTIGAISALVIESLWSTALIVLLGILVMWADYYAHLGQKMRKRDERGVESE